jgi:ankyrin repeat protein
MSDYFSDGSQRNFTDVICTRFLLAQLLMDSFRDKMTVRDVKSAIRNLPQGSSAYDKAYHDAMKRISAQGKGSSEMAKRILAWILCARHPLSILELLHALAVEPGDTEIDEDNILETGQLLTMCAGLVTVDEQSNNVRFVHYTTQEYLQRNQETWLPDAKIGIARSCIAYLSIDGLAVGPCLSQVDYENRLEELVLLEYAAVHWGLHLELLIGTGCVAAALNEINTEAQSLLLDDKRLGATSQVLFMSKRSQLSGEPVREEGKGFSSIHWIGRFGLLPLLEHWIDKRYELDECDISGRTSLSWAAESGQEAVVRQLLDTGKVDVDSKDTSGRTPLSRAAENGHEATVKRLIDTNKVDVDSKDKYGRTPLSWAAGYGHEATVKQLLDTKQVDLDSKDNNGRTILSWAAENGQEAIVKQLLDTKQVDLDPKDIDGRTPLSWATLRGHEATVKQLLDTKQVDVDSQDNRGRTPLSWAALRGHEATVKQMLDTKQVDLDSKDNNGRTPLSWAARYGQKATVEQLLDTKQVDLGSKDNNGRTPLSWAARYGQKATVEQLLDTKQVDLDSKDNNGRTPLSWAAENGQEAIVKQLLDTKQVDVDSKDNNGQTPLSWAAENGHEATVKQLLDTKQVDLDSKDNNGWTPLSWAARYGHKATVEQLLDTKQVNVDSKDNDGRSPISFAAQGGHESTAVLLLKNMTPVAAATESSVMVAKLNSSPTRPDCTPDTLGRTPSMWAAFGGKVSCIQSLWPSQLPTSSSTTMDKDSLGLSLIHLFAIGNCSDGISLVLDAGFDVNEPDSQGWTPLHWAAYFGNKEVSQFLVDRAADKGLKDSTGRTSYEISLFVGLKQLSELLRPHLVQDNPNALEVGQEFSAVYCDSCHRVSIL